MEKSAEIYEVPTSRRYWVVRAEGGLYYEHFVKFSMVALGHIDILDLPECAAKPFTPDLSEIKDKLRKYHEIHDRSSHHSSNHFNQVSHFIRDVAIGDWVITVGSSYLRVGRVTGHPRLVKEPATIVYDEINQKKFEMPYNLRRAVAWGPAVQKRHIPYGVLQSLKANQTLFNVDDHWEAIHHMLYPVFKRENDLYFSANLRVESEISNYSLTRFLLLLNEIEVIAKKIDEGLDKSNFVAEFERYADLGLLTLTTKAQFHSPGEIWNKLSFPALTKKNMAVAVFAYSTLFGNSQLGIDGIVDLHTRQKLWDLLIERMNENKVEKIREKLELKLPSYDTHPLESGNRDETQLA
jgi:predicted Mrr-cat superfamily restriction endonuclease